MVSGQDVAVDGQPLPGEGNIERSVQAIPSGWGTDTLANFHTANEGTELYLAGREGSRECHDPVHRFQTRRSF